MSFLIFKESIDSLKKASFLGVMGITIFFLTFIFIFIYKLINGLIPPIKSNYLIPNGNITEILSSLPTVFLAFTFQFNVFPIYLSLKSKKKSDMMKGTYIGVFFCLLMYLITGIIGLLMYGTDAIKGSVLSLLEQDIKNYKESDKIILVSVLIINVAFLISSTMSIPLMFFSLKKNFINSIIFCKKKFSKKKTSTSLAHIKDSKEYNILSTENNNEVETDEIGYKKLDVNLLNSFDENGNVKHIHSNNYEHVNSNKKNIIDKCSQNIIIISLYCLITGCTILVPGLDTVN